MSATLATVSYIGATILFILSLGGLSNPESSRRGNLYGMIGMTIAVLATVFGPQVTKVGGYGWIVGAMVVGAIVGIYAARIVKMTQMPELVALMHSLVGLAAMLVGFANYIDPAATADLSGRRKDHPRNGNLYRHPDRRGDLLRFDDRFRQALGQDQRQADAAAGAPLDEPRRPAGGDLLRAASSSTRTRSQAGMTPLIVMTVIALLFGIHMVMAIGGADMPVVVSMLNSYSGWAAAAPGFMLNNDLLIVTGALVGSSGAILSYIMCRAMNRHFISVIAGGFGTGGGTPAAAAGAQPAGEVNPILAAETAELLRESKERDHRAGLRHGGGAGAAHGVRDHQAAARERRQRALRHPPGGGPHARPHERAAGRGQGALRHRVRNGRVERGLPRLPTLPWSSAPTTSSILRPRTTRPARSPACRCSKYGRPRPRS